MLRLILLLVMIIVWSLNVLLHSMLGIDISACFESAQPMQELIWQVHMHYVVLCVRDCLSVLLDASIDNPADADIDAMSDQPWCG